MGTQITLPSLSSLAEKLERPLQEVERRAAQNKLAAEYANGRGADLEAAVGVMADMMYFAPEASVRYNAAKFMIEKIHGVGKEDGNTGPSIIINMNGDNAKAAAILNPNRDLESELPE